MSRLTRTLLFAVPLLIGALAAAAWLRGVGVDPVIDALSRVRPLGVLAMLGCTAAWLVLRFLRWQYLLRQSGIRVPIRPTISTYLAGLPGTATPAYVGELIRGVFLRRRFGTPLRSSTAVLVLERLYDVIALGVLLALFAGARREAAIGGLFALLGALLLALFWPLARRGGLDATNEAWLRSPGTMLKVLALSLAPWLVAALLFAGAGWALGIPISMAGSVRVFSLATLLGAVTLLPAGVGGMGSVAIVELGARGLGLSDAVTAVTLVRLMSTGVAMALGLVFLWRELRTIRELGAPPTVLPDAAAHFDEIAGEYNRQWSPHMWELLLGRKLDLMATALEGSPRQGIGLDLGCGLGIQVDEMTRRGFRVIGIDPSSGLLRAGRKHGLDLIAGSALELPFRNASLDFVYAIGVLHHLPGRQAQASAYREVARVLKPGGVFLIHESNPRNPLFRFYMGYLFPVLKSIDEGTEWWIDPAQPLATSAFVLDDVRFFTWLPDFTPRALLPAAISIERRLERGPFRSWSAHYMAVLRRGEVELRPAHAAAAAADRALAREDA
jgi:ubiquinone/menaquinone biosynthesis C-methylase UbiE/uncharacterized membrane protein YbhN (UPF0104 family)